MNILIDYEKCVRTKGVECRNCIDNCPMNIYGLFKEKPHLYALDRKVIPIPSKIDDCIECYSCKGSCPGGLDAFTITT